jgi:hypothetical protein
VTAGACPHALTMARTRKKAAPETQSTAPADVLEAPAPTPEPEPEPKPASKPRPEPEADAPPVEPPTPYAYAAPEHFEAIPQDFLVYSPEHAQGRALLGVLVDEIELPRDRSTGRALVLVLLEPVPLITADGTIVEGRPGQEVLVEITHFLRRLVRAARDPKTVGEVWLRPIGRLPTAAGDSITLWDLRHGKTFPRSSVRRGVS